MTRYVVFACNQEISIFVIRANQRFMPDAFQMDRGAMLKTVSFAPYAFDVAGTWLLLLLRLPLLLGQRPHDS